MLKRIKVISAFWMFAVFAALAIGSTGVAKAQGDVAAMVTVESSEESNPETQFLGRGQELEDDSLQTDLRTKQLEWIEYRDARYGYGLAMPNHWTVYPTPLEGRAATLTIMNYDESLVRVYAKGDSWPEGAIKIDVVVFEEMDPGLSIEEVIYQKLENDFSTIESIEEAVLVDSQSAISVTSATRDNPSDRHEVIAFRISQDKIMIIGLMPENAWESPDVQAILDSVAFSPQEEIVVPSITPAAPPSLAVKNSALEPTIIHPCDWGNEVGESPIELHMPFANGTTWTVGGWGYYYGDGTHNNTNNDYYATDWNKGTYASPEDDFGQPVYPVAGGQVIATGTLPNGYGNYVKIQHAEGVTTLYAHLSSINVNENDQVNTGTHIGNVGSTGNSEGSHLHLTFRVGGVSKYDTPPSRRPSPMRTAGGWWSLCDSQSRTVAVKKPFFALVSQDKYWVCDLTQWQWTGQGFFKDLGPDNIWKKAPKVGGYYPWESDGITAGWIVDDLFGVVSKDRFWTLRLSDMTWVGWGYFRDLPDNHIFKKAPKVGGKYPWEGHGITAGWVNSNQFTLVSRDKYWVCDLTQWQWTGQGFFKDLGPNDTWKKAPKVGGFYPWELDGITGGWIVDDLFGVVSKDRFWTLRLSDMTWVGSGHFRDLPDNHIFKKAPKVGGKYPWEGSGVTAGW